MNDFTQDILNLEKDPYRELARRMVIAGWTEATLKRNFSCQKRLKTLSEVTKIKLQNALRDEIKGYTGVSVQYPRG